MSESKDREIKDLEKEKLRLEIRALSSWRKWVPVLAPVITVVGTGVILWLSNFFEASAIQLQNRKDSLNYAIQQHQSTLDSFKRKNGLMKDSVSLMKDSISVNTRPKTPMLGQCIEVALPWLEPCQCFLFLVIGASG